MKAMVLREFGPPKNLRWETVPTPTLHAGEALLRVRSVSINLFHVEFRSGRALQVPLPRIMGSGPAGEVAAVASDVQDIVPGQRVVVCNNVSCGNCRFCRAGRETLCADLNSHRSGMIGVHRDGGYAEFTAVPARNLIALPDAVSFEQACVVPTTIGPVFKACTARAGVRPGENVLIVGAGGGMGLHAVQMARVCGGRIIAALRSERAAQAVVQAGADVLVSTLNRDWPQQVKDLTDGWGADVVLDFVATRETLQASLATLAPGGRLVIMGYFPKGHVVETPTWVFTEEVVVTGNRSAGRQDVAEALSLIENGRITPVLGATFPLQEAARAHTAFEAGEIVGRAVLAV